MACTAAPCLGGGGYEISDHDADGVGSRLVAVTYSNSVHGPEAVEQAARLLVIGRNLEGGWKRAIELLRAESVRQQQGG